MIFQLHPQKNKIKRQEKENASVLPPLSFPSLSSDQWIRGALHCPRGAEVSARGSMAPFQSSFILERIKVNGRRIRFKHQTVFNESWNTATLLWQPSG